MIKKWKYALLTVSLLGMMVSLAGCKPYDTPEFVTIEANQTAFVIPLEGQSSEQGQFESLDLLKKSQVATKRIQIPHKWIQKGRWYRNGEWVATVRVIVVDRYPETREWKTGENGQGFIGESKDSIKFSVGLSATAQILEEDTALFLYRYAGKTLKEVMDSEIRNKIGTVLLERYGSLSIDEIRSSKAKVIEHVRSEVEPYFKKRGITLSNIGYIGDLNYVQADVQEAINKAFKEEQDKKAQEIINQKELAKAEAEAEAVRIRASTIEAQIRLRELENERAWIEKWNGQQPSTVLGSNATPMVNVSPPTSTTK
ncbi:SPFH domain-containing protein (plasmid) [Paenibacillus thiaminolyticus]|uniref:SPFH domain-containing protein n=1 Tax=Paenibacillus thiaminolyticus TaxID=49283 RepID=UPI00232BB0C7|nr:SPFH domain-containing protein [Paenibacillus thiaminolyticus]WCF11498.1 SPFH domain-containing protein [Paenibacillus thiaminolyticus]